MSKNFSNEARAAAQKAYEDEYETRWFQLSDDYQDELTREAQDKIDLENPQYTPTKPTDEETKAELRKIFRDIAAEKNLTDREFIDYIDNSVEEMFAIMKNFLG